MMSTKMKAPGLVDFANGAEQPRTRTDLQKEMFWLTNVYTVSQCIFTATALGLADLLADGGKSCDELAAATETQSVALYRLLTALDDIGVVKESGPRYFELAPLGSCLLTGSDNSLRNYILLTADHYYACWPELPFSLRTGTSAFVHQHGKEQYAYVKERPALAAIFDQAMIELSNMHNDPIVNAYDFSGVGRVIDVGGGQGGMALSLLRRYPHLRVVVFDQPHVIERARPFLAQRGVLDRCELVGGDFFAGLPGGVDVCLVKNVLNDWDDAQALTILGHCRQAIGSNGRLLVAQRVGSAEATLETKILDMNKLLIRSASRSIRTEEDWRQLFDKAGLALERVIPTETEYKIVEGVWKEA